MNELITDPGLKNWIKACLGLKCVRDGMLPFIEQKCEDLYSDNSAYSKAFTNLTTYSCVHCCVQNVKPFHSMSNCPLKGHIGKKVNCACSSKNKKVCPTSGACGVLYDRIMGEHLNMAPRWDNSDCPQWYLNGWEQIKCYIDIPGYKEKELSQADVTAFVHICQNNKKLNTLCLAHLDKLIQVRFDRNEIFHSGDMCVSDDKLKEYFGNVRAVLKLPMFKDFTTHIQNELDRLTKIEGDVDIYVNTLTEIEARKDALSALIGDTQSIEEAERMNTSQDNTDYRRQIAEIAVLREKHITSISKCFRTITEHLESIRKQYISILSASLKQSTDLETITSELAGLTKDLVTLHKKLEEQTEVICGIQKITLDNKEISTENNRMLRDVKNDVKTTLLVVQELQQKMGIRITNVPGRVTTVCNGVNEGSSKTVFSKILMGLKNAVHRQGYQINDKSEQCFKDIVSHIEKDGNQIVDIQNGSVVINIQCQYLSSWVRICESCIDGSMERLFRPLQDQFRSEQGCEELVIIVDMYERDFIETADKILKQVYSQLSDVIPNEITSTHISKQQEDNDMQLDDVLRCLLEHNRSIQRGQYNSSDVYTDNYQQHQNTITRSHRLTNNEHGTLIARVKPVTAYKETQTDPESPPQYQDLRSSTSSVTLGIGKQSDNLNVNTNENTVHKLKYHGHKPKLKKGQTKKERSKVAHSQIPSTSRFRTMYNKVFKGRTSLEGYYGVTQNESINACVLEDEISADEVKARWEPRSLLPDGKKKTVVFNAETIDDDMVFDDGVVVKYKWSVSPVSDQSSVSSSVKYLKDKGQTKKERSKVAHSQIPSTSRFRNMYNKVFKSQYKEVTSPEETRVDDMAFDDGEVYSSMKYLKDKDKKRKKRSKITLYRISSKLKLRTQRTQSFDL